jgi:hypothetical protein
MRTVAVATVAWVAIALVAPPATADTAGLGLWVEPGATHCNSVMAYDPGESLATLAQVAPPVNPQHLFGACTYGRVEFIVQFDPTTCSSPPGLALYCSFGSDDSGITYTLNITSSGMWNLTTRTNVVVYAGTFIEVA